VSEPTQGARRDGSPSPAHEALGCFVALLVGASAPAMPADVDALEAAALLRVEARIECQETPPDERDAPCDRCAEGLYPLEEHLPAVVACEARHWLGLIAENAALPPCARQSMGARLAELSAPWPLARLQHEYVPQRFAIERPQMSLDPDDPMGVTFGRWVLFEGAPDEVELARESGTPAAAAEACTVADEGGRAQLVEAAVSVNGYAARANQGLLARGAEGLARLRDDWAWFLAEGLGQFPWERAMNAALDRRGGIDVLPKRQWVLFHPSVAFEIDEADLDLDNLRVQEALLVEPLGFVRYEFGGTPDKAERSLWGASLLLSVRNDRDPGYGLLLRRGTLGLGAISREVVGEDDSATDEVSVVLTMDVLGRLQKGQEKYQRYSRTLSTLLD